MGVNYEKYNDISDKMTDITINSLRNFKDLRFLTLLQSECFELKSKIGKFNNSKEIYIAGFCDFIDYYGYNEFGYFSKFIEHLRAVLIKDTKCICSFLFQPYNWEIRIRFLDLFLDTIHEMQLNYERG